MPLGARFFLLPENAVAAAAQVLSYDPTTTPPTLSPMPAATAVKALEAAWQAGAQLYTAGKPQGGLAAAGGLQFAAGMGTADKIVATSDGATAVQAMLSSARAGAAMVTIPDASGTTTQALVAGGAADADPTHLPPPFEVVSIAPQMVTAASASSTLMSLPSYFQPTLTLLDAPASPLRRILISGGLAIAGAKSVALQPPSPTMQVVTMGKMGDPLATVQLGRPGGVALDTTCGLAGHFKPVAFDAASLLPSGDRVLSTGGTPREPTNCAGECDNGEGGLTCAVTQASIISVGAAADPSLVTTLAAPLQLARFGHTQSLLPDGTVLIAGGLARRGSATMPITDVEIWNPARLAPLANDVDDPLYADLAAMNLTRKPGDLARDKDGNAHIACSVPTK